MCVIYCMGQNIRESNFQLSEITSYQSEASKRQEFNLGTVKGGPFSPSYLFGMIKSTSYSSLLKLKSRE